MSKIISRNGLLHYYVSIKGKPHYRSLHTKNVREARLLKRAMDQQMLEKRLGLDKPRVTLKEFLERYLEYSRVNKARETSRIDQRVLRDFMAFAGDITLSRVAPPLLEDWKIRRAKQAAPRTVNEDLRHLKAAFSLAHQWELIDRDPAKRVKPLPVD